jgi:streptogramin lyase
LGITTACFLLALAPSVSSARELEEPGIPNGGRAPGQPDVEKVAGTTYSFIPGRGDYEISSPGQPTSWEHQDLNLSGEVEGAEANASEGASRTGIALPEAELEPICRTSGNRVVAVYAHELGVGEPTPTEQIRNAIRRMTWKIADQSAQSSQGKRVVRLAVDCESSGQIAVHTVLTKDLTLPTVSAADKEQVFGSPEGSSAVKYLSWVAGPGSSSEILADASKSPANKNATHTNAAIKSAGSYEQPYATIANHTAIHELFHSLGAVQGNGSSPAPYSTTGWHCVDGLDVMCYEDHTTSAWGLATATRCPESEYETPVKLPIDCGKDTYFNARPAAGTWLAEHWDLAGPEDPFLVAPPSEAATKPASAVSSSGAQLNGAFNPEGAYVSYWWEYASGGEYQATGKYSSSTKPTIVAFGASVLGVNAAVSGLQPNSTYHYRIAAKSDAGTVYGTDETLTTTGPPVNTVLPGTVPVGPLQAVPEEATVGTWSNEPSSYSYQWQRCTGSGGECVNLSGATTSVYTPVAADVGHALVVRVTASNSFGSTVAGSAPTGKVEPLGQITEYTVGNEWSAPQGLAKGPEGAMWFADYSRSAVGKVTPNGSVTSYLVPAEAQPWDITQGPDGNMWFTERGSDKIGRITSSGTITEYSLPDPTSAHPYDIAAGPDGNLWFAVQGTSKIGKITTAGAVTEYAVAANSAPFGIVAGPDGKMWFTEHNGNRIGKITTSGAVTEYALPWGSSGPYGIAVGPDGNLWFALGNSAGNSIAKSTTSGVITRYPVPPANSGPFEVAPGPDGYLWFTEGAHNGVGRISTTGTITEFPLPAGWYTWGIAVGSDKKMWFAEHGTSSVPSLMIGKIGKIVP